MEETIYIYHELINGEYIKCTDSDEFATIGIEPLDTFQEIFADYSLNRINQFKVPKKYLILLNELLDKYEISIKEDFHSLLAYLQYQYILYSKDDSNDKMDSDYISEKKDFESLLETLKLYLLGNKNELHSISFKFRHLPTKAVNNFFVINDIYKSICYDFGITKDNFDVRKQEILSTLDASSLLKVPERLKSKTITSIFDYLINREFNQSQSLEFIGVFLHICQIHSNNNQPFDIFNTLNKNLKEVDVKNLRQYIKRPKF